MRLRKLTADGDYSFGRGPTEFWINTPAGVAQAIQQRLLLWTGEWFLDETEGTPYATLILGRGTQATYDQAIKERILGTEGVLSIDQYVSLLTDDRKLSVFAAITTIYGGLTIAIEPENANPRAGGRLNVDFVLNYSTLG